MQNALRAFLAAQGIDIKTFRQWVAEKLPIDIFLLDSKKPICLTLADKLRELMPQTGYYPVILGNEGDLTRHRESMMLDENPESPRQIIQAAQSIDAKQWLADGWVEYLADDPEHHLDFVLDEWELLSIPKSHRSFIVPAFDRRNDLRVIGLIPTSESWCVPAYLQFGGWNGCPLPEEHCAVQHYWQQRYETQIISATFDTIEMFVKNPPVTREDALSLAIEQMIYCPDIVTQGVGTLKVLAADLLHGHFWYFWWD